MESKILEVRDRLTYIPVVATKLEPSTPQETYHLRRTGYHSTHIIVTTLTDVKTCYLYNYWPNDSRTMREAHKYISQHYDELTTGDVIDVEYILGETDKKKRSEYHD